MKTMRPNLSRAEDGIATIEFAAVAGALCILALGVLDFGLGFWEQMEVSHAAGAGADYVMANGYSSSTGSANIQTAGTNATNLSGMTVNSNSTCGCPTSTGVKTGTGLGTYPTCGRDCTGVSGGSGTSLPYVTVTASVTYSTIFTWPGLSNPVTLSATAIAPN
jgi:Flp pilus assembly protein TadG